MLLKLPRNVSKGKIKRLLVSVSKKMKSCGNEFSTRLKKKKTKKALGTDKNLKEWGISTGGIMRFMFCLGNLLVEITLLPSFSYRGGCHVHAEAM